MMLKVLAATALTALLASEAAAQQPQRVVYSGPPTVTERCQAIAYEYRVLRARGELRGDVRRELLQRFHRTGCFGEAMIIASPVEYANLPRGR